VSPHVEEIDSTTATDSIAASADQLDVSCSIEASVCAKLSFATHQSAVPVLRDLRVTNNSDHSLQDLELEISADPAVFVPRMWKLDRIQPRSSTDIRNRDLVRESVLQQLGWKLLRVWSTDWWIDRRAALQQLHARLQVLLAERRELDQEAERKRLEEEARTSQVVATLNDSPGLTDESSVAPKVQPSEPVFEEATFAIETLPVTAEELPLSVDDLASRSAHLANSTLDTVQQGVYRATSFDTEKAHLKPNEFFEPAYSPQLAELIAKIVNQESPVKGAVIVERVARAHGFLRSGNRIRERVLSLTQSAHYLLMEDGGETFVWSDPDTAGSWSLARYPATSNDCRSIEDIALVELAAAFPPLDPDSYVIQVARNFGVKRLSVQARSRLERASAARNSNA